MRFRRGLKIAIVSFSTTVAVAAYAVDAAKPEPPTPRIAFTFDDAPMPDSVYMKGLERTKILIERLKRAGVLEVAFFSNTKGFANDDGKARMQLYAQAGHLIGNHTDSHLDLNKTDSETFDRDIFKAHKILSQMPNFRLWFRFPMLHEGENLNKRDIVRAYLKGLGYEPGYVTIDTYDWYMNRLFEAAVRKKKKIDFEKLGALYVEALWQSADFFNRMALDQLGNQVSHVILLHENDLAALYIDKLAAKFNGAGWQIIPPAEAYRDQTLAHQSVGLMNNQGRIAALASDKGYAGPFSSPYENEKNLDRLFRDQKVFR